MVVGCLLCYAGSRNNQLSIMFMDNRVIGNCYMTTNLCVMYIFINKQLVGGMGYLDVAGRKRA
jgi:hypothetical protein